MGTKLHRNQSEQVPTHFCLVTSGTMTYSSKGSKKTTFSLAYENAGAWKGEEVGPLPTKKWGET